MTPEKQHALKGTKQSPEHIARKARKCQPGCECKRHVRTPEQKARHARAASEASKKLWAEGAFEGRADKIRATRATWTPERRSEESRKKSEAVKQHWAEGKHANKRPPTRRRVSNHEYALAPYLAKLGYRHNNDSYTFIGRKVPDFVDIEGRRVFEYFGSFWHPDRDEEQRIIAYYASKGWTCEVLWEDDLFKWLASHKELVTGSEHDHAWKAAHVNNGYRKPEVG